MTVAVNDRLSGPHNGDGVTTSFGYDWYILANTELRVILRDDDDEDTVQTLTTHYSVTGVGTGTGNVVFVTAPPSGYKVIIEGVTPKSQTVDYENNDRFPYTSHQAGMDKIVRQIQELQRDVDRTVKYPHGETAYRLPVKPADETQLLGRTTDGEIVHLTGADLGSNVEIAALALIIDEIEQVAAIDAEVVIVADAMADVELVADNISAVQSAADLLRGHRTLESFGAVGDGVADDKTAIDLAIAEGVPLVGTPGATYRYVGRMLVGDYFNLDLKGATFKPEYTCASGDTAGTRAAIRTADNALGAINTVSSYTVGTNQVTLSTTPSGISVGSFVGFFGTTLGGRWPITWRFVTNIAGNVLTLDEVIPYTIGGTVTCRAGNFRDAFIMRNGFIDCAALADGTADVEAIIINESVRTRILSNLTFINVDLAGASSLALDTSYCLDVVTEHCVLENAVMNGGVETCLSARSYKVRDCQYTGPGFGFAPVNCDDFTIKDCEISGTEYAAPSVSVRGIRPIGCLTGSIENNTITDIDTGIKLEDCANIITRGNKLRYCGTGIAACSDQYPSSRSGGYIIDNNIVDQFGGEGISVGGNSTGDGLWQPIVLTNNRAGSTRVGSTHVFVVRGGTIIADGNIATDWSSGSSPFVTATVDGQLTKGVLGSFVANANTTSGRLGIDIASTHTGLAIDDDLIVCNAPAGKFQSRPTRRTLQPGEKGHISGLTLSNNGSDATNDIDIAAGQCADSTGAVLIVLTALTKRLDANWAAGTNQGMRNSAAAITDTTYHIYAVCKAGGLDPDIYAHTSATVATVLTALQAETGGSSFVYARRIGSIVRASSTILLFHQSGDTFRWDSAALDINSNSAGTSAVTRTLRVPTGIVVEAIVNCAITAGSEDYATFTPLDATDVTPGAPNNMLWASPKAAGQFRIKTNTSAQVRSRQNTGGASETLYMGAVGWVDTRDRFA